MMHSSCIVKKQILAMSETTNYKQCDFYKSESQFMSPIFLFFLFVIFYITRLIGSYTNSIFFQTCCSVVRLQDILVLFAHVLSWRKMVIGELGKPTPKNRNSFQNSSKKQCSSECQKLLQMVEFLSV